MDRFIANRHDIAAATRRTEIVPANDNAALLHDGAGKTRKPVLKHQPAKLRFGKRVLLRKRPYRHREIVADRRGKRVPGQGRGIETLPFQNVLNGQANKKSGKEKNNSPDSSMYYRAMAVSEISIFLRWIFMHFFFWELQGSLQTNVSFPAFAGNDEGGIFSTSTAPLGRR